MAKAAKGRPDDAPLLLQADGTPWPAHAHDGYKHQVAEIIAGMKLGPEHSLYCLRHSAIVRKALAGMPVALIAEQCDTSPQIIRSHYGKYLSEAANDAQARLGLLQPEAPAAGNVLPLVRP